MAHLKSSLNTFTLIELSLRHLEISLEKETLSKVLQQLKTTKLDTKHIVRLCKLAEKVHKEDEDSSGGMTANFEMYNMILDFFVDLGKTQQETVVAGIQEFLKSSEVHSEYRFDLDEIVESLLK